MQQHAKKVRRPLSETRRSQSPGVETLPTGSGEIGRCDHPSASGKRSTPTPMELRSGRITTMRTPEEGPPDIAGHTSGSNANDQILEVGQRASRRERSQELPLRTEGESSQEEQRTQGTAAPVRNAAGGRRQSLTLTGTQRHRIMWRGR